MRLHFMRVAAPATIWLSAICLFVGLARGQQACTIGVDPRSPASVEIFSIEQERTLGDVEAELVESTFHPATDGELAAHLNVIVARMLLQFPHAPMAVRVILIETPEANSFSIGPERIYITRKMVALLRNDDELAGLLGHELSHVLTHQNSIIVSQLFQQILGVNAVGDRKDIREKLWRMLDNIDRDPKLLRKTAAIMEKQERMCEDEADRVALYATAAAGFSPRAYLELFERSEGISGSSGSILSDYFGAANSNQRRHRQIQRTLMQLPQSCRVNVPVASSEFRAWQAAVKSDPREARDDR